MCNIQNNIIATIIDRNQKIYEKFILEIVDKFFPVIRKRKYSNEYFLIHFQYILQDVTRWKSLTITITYHQEHTYHYKYINQVFNKWSSKNVFELAYNKLLHFYYFSNTNILHSRKLGLFIDAFFVNNLCGTENVTKNPEYKKKQVTKMSTICDQHKNVLGITNIPTFNNEEKKCNVFNHEVTYVQETIDKIPITIPIYVKTTICGDKGYISQNSFNLNGKLLKMIAPKRKNQKTKNTKQEKKILSNRYVVENSIKNIKQYGRTYVRKDKKIKNFMSFIFLGLAETFCKKYSLFVT